MATTLPQWPGTISIAANSTACVGAGTSFLTANQGAIIVAPVAGGGFFVSQFADDPSDDENVNLMIAPKAAITDAPYFIMPLPGLATQALRVRQLLETLAALPTVEGQIDAAAEAVLADADEFGARQDASGNLIKRTWANVKAQLASVFLGGSTSATDNALLRADGVDGNKVQASLVIVDDDGNTAIPGNVAITGTTSIGAGADTASQGNTLANVHGAGGANIAVRETGNGIELSLGAFSAIGGVVVGSMSNHPVHLRVNNHDVGILTATALQMSEPITYGGYALVPAGGSPGQFLRKKTATDYDTGWASGRGANKIINGKFDFWQRGTSQTTTGYWSADRWAIGFAGTGYVARIEMSAGTVPNTQYGIGIQQTGGAGSAINIEQCIEDVRTLAGKTVTVTFWAWADANNPNVEVRLDQVFGTGGSATAYGTPADVALTANVWKQYSVTLAVPSVAGKTIGDSSYLALVILNSTTGAPNTLPSTLQMSRISVVEGDATAEVDPYEDRPIQQERALCERYFEAGNADLLAAIFCGDVTSGSTYFLEQKFRTMKRATPTMVLTNGAQNGFPAAAGSATAGPEGFQESRTANGTISGGYFFSNYTADAELG